MRKNRITTNLRVFQVGGRTVEEEVWVGRDGLEMSAHDGGELLLDENVQLAQVLTPVLRQQQVHRELQRRVRRMRMRLGLLRVRLGHIRGTREGGRLTRHAEISVGNQCVCVCVCV